MEQIAVAGPARQRWRNASRQLRDGILRVDSGRRCLWATVSEGRKAAMHLRQSRNRISALERPGKGSAGETHRRTTEGGEMSGIETWADYLAGCWAVRKCFICREYGECAHREPKAESVRMFWRAKRAWKRAA